MFWNTIFRFSLFWIERLKVDYVPLKRHKRKIYWTSQQGTKKWIFRSVFQIRFGINTTTMIQQVTIITVNVFRIESFDSWLFSFGGQEGEKKKWCRRRKQCTAYSELPFEKLTLNSYRNPTFSKTNSWNSDYVNLFVNLNRKFIA